MSKEYEGVAHFYQKLLRVIQIFQPKIEVHYSYVQGVQQQPTKNGFQMFVEVYVHDYTPFPAKPVSGGKPTGCGNFSSREMRTFLTLRGNSPDLFSWKILNQNQACHQGIITILMAWLSLFLVFVVQVYLNSRTTWSIILKSIKSV